jgi:hypothetical protein
MPKLPPLEHAPRSGCLNCPPKPTRLNLNDYLDPGFGYVRVQRDGEDILFDVRGEIARPGRRAENAARKDPDHDWRIVIESGMGGVVYQRHGRNEWVAVESLRGFA